MRDTEQLEEERRLLFVGMTRAQEELQLSLTKEREFRGQRKHSVPSPFILELPFDELDASQGVWSDEGAARRGTVDLHDDGFEVHAEHDEPVWSADESSGTDSDDALEFPPREMAAAGDESAEHADDDALEFPPREVARGDLISRDTETGDAVVPSAAAPARRLNMAGLTTAAQLLSGMSSDDSSERFHHGMQVSHPEYGPGHIIALSGNGPRRTATVEFASVGVKRFVLAQSPLEPIEPA
jgi:DNA helicase II / ATP-dependent DNA helicase PcrA